MHVESLSALISHALMMYDSLAFTTICLDRKIQNGALLYPISLSNDSGFAVKRSMLVHDADDI